MIVRLVIGLLADMVFESAATRRRRLDAKLTRYLARGRRSVPPAPTLRKPD
jgi:hypothetical protein